MGLQVIDAGDCAGRRFALASPFADLCKNKTKMGLHGVSVGAECLVLLAMKTTIELESRC